MAPESGNCTSYTRTAFASLLSCCRQSCCSSQKFAFRLLCVHLRVCVPGVYVQAKFAGNVRVAGCCCGSSPRASPYCTDAALVASRAWCVDRGFVCALVVGLMLRALPTAARLRSLLHRPLMCSTTTLSLAGSPFWQSPVADGRCWLPADVLVRCLLRPYRQHG